MNEPQFAAAGLNYGYAYHDSPIIAYDGENAPSYTMGSYTPSTVPGCRAPHFTLADGSSLYDYFSPGYTAIASRGVDISVLAGEAAERGIPLAVVEVDTLPDEYLCPLTVVRQDQTVVWRGAPPDRAAAAELWAKLRGA